MSMQKSVITASEGCSTETINSLHMKMVPIQSRLKKHVAISHDASGHSQPATVSPTEEAGDVATTCDSQEPGGETSILPGTGRLLQPIREDVSR